MSNFQKALGQVKSDQSFTMGKMPPQAVEIEEAVLGALLLEKGAIAQVSDFLIPEMFYKDAHKEIYRAISDLENKAQAIDILTVTNELRSKANLEFIGGPLVISQLTNKVGSSANIEYHARIVAESWIGRELISVCSEITNEAFKETSDIFELLDNLQGKITELYNGTNEASYESIGQILPKAIQRIDEVSAMDNHIIGITSGNSLLDFMLNGFVDTRFIVVAGRTSMGKTTKMISWAYKAAVWNNYPTLIFSLEQDKIELTLKLLSAHTQIDHRKISTGDLTKEEYDQINTMMSELDQAPLFIEDRPRLTPQQIRAISKRLVYLSGIKFILIDYLQIMGTNLKNPTKLQQVTDNSEFCKSLAKELGVPVIGFAQLSRAVENRGGSCRPQLSDLKESGAIEENADQVLFLYRPEYYGITVEEGESTEGVTEIIVAKNRHGDVGSVKERSDLGTSSFDEEPRGSNQPVQTNWIENQYSKNDDEVPF